MRPGSWRTVSGGPVGLILAAPLIVGVVWSCGSPSATPSPAPARNLAPKPAYEAVKAALAAPAS